MEPKLQVQEYLKKHNTEYLSRFCILIKAEIRQYSNPGALNFVIYILRLGHLALENVFYMTGTQACTTRHVL